MMYSVNQMADSNQDEHVCQSNLGGLRLDMSRNFQNRVTKWRHFVQYEITVIMQSVTDYKITQLKESCGFLDLIH